MFAIVEFPKRIGDDCASIEIICESWIIGKLVRFPNNSIYNNCLNKKKMPGSNWKKYPFKLLKSSILDLDAAKMLREKYCKFTDTASELELHATQKENKKHPINRISNKNKNNTYKSMLVELKEKVRFKIVN
jgi:hypothetical protein